MNGLFDPGYILRSIPKLLIALPLSLMLTVGSLIGGLLIGVVTTAFKLGKNRVLRGVATVYVSYIRGTPPLVQIFLIYYGLPSLLALCGINTGDWSRNVFSILTFSLYCGAFLSEVIRASYSSVDKGQMEAALSVGMKKSQAVWRIILPQALVNGVPNFGNSVISVYKDISLLFTIG